MLFGYVGEDGLGGLVSLMLGMPWTLLLLQGGVLSDNIFRLTGADVGAFLVFISVMMNAILVYVVTTAIQRSWRRRSVSNMNISHTSNTR